MAKINKKELEGIQEVIANLEKVQQAVGSLELQKQDYVSQYSDLKVALQERREALKEKYGDINVNLGTGEYTKLEQE